MRTKQGLAAALVAVALAIFVGGNQVEAATIGGTVGDLDGAGVRGVTVEVIANGDIIAREMTDVGGKYSVNTRDRQVVSLRFSAPGRVTFSVNNLNGKVNQQISVIIAGKRE